MLLAISIALLVATLSGRRFQTQNPHHSWFETY